jgi:hypothetical protein
MDLLPHTIMSLRGPFFIASIGNASSSSSTALSAT